MPVYNPLLRRQILQPSASAAIVIHRGKSKHARRVGFRTSKRMRFLTLLIVGLLLSGTVIDQVEAFRFFRRIGGFFRRAATRVFRVVTRIPVIGNKVQAVANVVRSVARGDIKGALVGAATNLGPLAKIRSIANVVSKIPGVGSKLGSVTGALNSFSRLDIKGGIKHAKGIGGDLKNIARSKIAVLRPIGGIVKSVARGDIGGALGSVTQMASGVVGGLIPQMAPQPEAEAEEPPEPLPAPAASVEAGPPAGELAQAQAAPAPVSAPVRNQQPVTRASQAITQVRTQPAQALPSYSQQPAIGANANPATAPGAFGGPFAAAQQPGFPSSFSSPVNTPQPLVYGSATVQNIPGAMPVPFSGGQQLQAMPFNGFSQAHLQQQQVAFASMMGNGFQFQPNPNVYGLSAFTYPTMGASAVPIIPGQCYCPCASMAAQSVVPPPPTSCGCGDSRSWMTPHDEDEYFAGDQEYIDEISVADGGRIPMRVLQVIRAIQAGRIGQYVNNNVVEDGGRWQPKQRTRIVRRVRIGKNGAGIAGRGGRRRQ
ncbi:hypothetical protein BCR44DRAFT_95310 [Catenaria anguillulae PL171]|uniref:Uncharacterized protein n=1 Tax=Catenaria anguillulae PL171 TaxID=765915 RepID=A0A1Y2HCF9_9FUNG|nr:hypothetical protein BCR44DRAFT_95310 [Catenaria anguillulae PL171]